MISAHGFRRSNPWTWIACWSLLWLPTMALPSTAVAKKVKAPEPLEVAQTLEIPEDLLLDVGIQIFDPGLPPEDENAREDEGVFAEVRKAEARFMPVRLMDTLQSTGYWGAVRVLPQGAGQVDLLVTGRIVESTGLELEIEVEAHDSRGVEWLRKRSYRAEADARAYREDVAEEPFQHLYNFLANRLRKEYTKQDDDELLAVRRVSKLRFAADVAPMVFEDYLDRDRKGHRVVRRLPADGDPMAERVAMIRERDYLFIDTLTEHYAGFTAQMAGPYDSWRSFSFEEMENLKKLKKQARTRKILGGLAIAGAILGGSSNSNSEAAARDLAIYAGIRAIESGMGKTQEAKLHRESLRELAISFNTEVAPVLVEVEGQTLRLSGSVETQYAEWRRLLREMFSEETGVLANPDDVASAPGRVTGPPPAVDDPELDGPDPF